MFEREYSISKMEITEEWLLPLELTELGSVFFWSFKFWKDEMPYKRLHFLIYSYYFAFRRKSKVDSAWCLLHKVAGESAVIICLRCYLPFSYHRFKTRAFPNSKKLLQCIVNFFSLVLKVKKKSPFYIILCYSN